MSSSEPLFGADNATGTGCPGTLTQLIAVGACEAFLITDPSTTFFKSEIVKHTNFATEHVRIQASGGSCQFDSTQIFTIEKCGDLVSHVYGVATLPGIYACGVGSGNDRHSNRFPVADPAQFPVAEVEHTALDTRVSTDGFYDDLAVDAKAPWCSWINGVGYALVENASLVIGSQTICTTYGVYLDIYDELSKSFDNRPGTMIGKYQTRGEAIEASKRDQTIYVPLGFYFTETTTKALPVVSMRFHKVSVSLKIRRLEELIVVSGPGVEVRLVGTNEPIAAKHLKSINLLVKYIFLDLAERDQFAVSTFVTLINQVGGQTIEVPKNTRTVTAELTCNGPVSEIIWVARLKSNDDANHHFDYSGPDGRDPIINTSLYLNGAARFNCSAEMARMVGPYESHTCIPSKHIYTYSFALDPQASHSSGSLNFSRIDRSRMTFTMSDAFVKSGDSGRIMIFTKGWNVLSTGNGMGSCRFS